MTSSVRVGLAIIIAMTTGACSGKPAETSAASEASGTPARIGRAPLTHIGFAVRDVNAAAKAWSHVLGIPASDVRTVALSLPDKTTAEIKVASLVMPNTEIELNQPVTERGPVQEQIERFGPGVHYIGFSVPDGVDRI